ncbi:uncharacterized protein LOC144451739 [Glandiceps talaboti]
MGSKDNLAYNLELNQSEIELSKTGESRKGRLTGTLALSTLVVCLGASFQYGYGTGVLTAPSPFIQSFYNSSYNDRYGTLSTLGLDILWATTISVYCVGGAFGALAAAPLGDILGRKGGLLLNNIFSIAASLLFGFSEMANNFEMVIIGRVILGFYAGVGITIVPLFLAEISPKNLRGAIGFNNQLAITVGILIAQVLGIFALNTADTWVILLSIPGSLSVLMLLILPCCPESPRWLLIKNHNAKGAEQALKRYMGEDDVSMEMAEMRVEFAEEQKEPKVGITGLFTNRNYRKPLIISIGIHAGQQFSGINAIFFYATEIYYMIWPNNDDAVLWATVGTGAINVLMTIVAVLVVEKTGRRKLLLFPLFGMVIFMAMITVSLNLADPNSNDAWDFVSLACVYGYIVCFAVGPGPIPFVLVAELWSQGPRPAAMSLSVQVNWWCNFVVGLTFPFIQEAIGAYTFLVFMVFLIAFAIFTYFMVPETKNKTFEEIIAQFRVKQQDTDMSTFENNNAEMGRLTLILFVTSLVVAIAGSGTYGYGTGVISAPSKYIQHFYNDTFAIRNGEEISDNGLLWLWSTTVSVYCIGGAFGALIAAPCGDRFGRKGFLLINSIFSIIASLFMGLSEVATSYEMIVVGRTILGFYAGAGITIVPVYLSEIAPKNLRGAIGIMHQLAITIGILLAQIFGIFVFNTEETWPILLAFSAVFAILQLIVLPFCPESPRWLLITKGNTEKARKALRRYRGEHDVAHEIREMRIEYEEESKEEKVGIKGLFTNINYRKPMMISILLQAGQQFSGINAIFFYATEIYFMIWPSNVTAVMYATIGSGVVNVAVTLVAIAIVEKIGRRPLLIYPYIVMSLSTVMITVSLNLAVPNVKDAWDYISLICVYGYIVCFAVGPGPLAFVVISEIWSQGPRQSAMSVAVQTNWWCNFIVGITFPYIQASIGAYTFLVFTALLTCTSILVVILIPETKNRTFEEIVSSFRVK